MQFSIQKDVILNGLKAVEKATSARGVQPVLSNVLIETVDNKLLKLCATDLDIAIEVKIPASVETMGSTTLPAKKLLEIISKLPDNMINFSLNPENNLTQITCGKSKFDLIGISASEFPAITELESDDSIKVEIEPLLKAIKQTSFAAATYDTNSVLSGVYFEVKDNTFEMAATDGNRLAKFATAINNSNEKEYSVVIPSKTLLEFTKILAGTEDKTVSIIIKNGQVAFKLEDRFLVSRLLDGQYPKYKQLIPSNYEITAIAERDTLISALDRTATIVNEKTSVVKFDFDTDKLNLSADTPDVGDSSDQIEIDYKGDELSIAFNCRYVLDTLKVMDSDKVRLEFGGPLSSALIKPDSEEDYLCLVMPVQIR